jgi:hypothetical protein
MSGARDVLNARVGAILYELELAPAARRGGGWSVELPSIKRRVIGVGILGHERTVRMATFVLRAPDRDQITVYRRMLERNMHMAYWRFGIDIDGDIYLAAHLDDGQLSLARVDEMLGLLVSYVDETYEGLLRTGFDIPAHIQLGPQT